MYISISHSVSLWQYLLNVHIIKMKTLYSFPFPRLSHISPSHSISSDVNVSILFDNHSQISHILSMRSLKWKSKKEHLGYHYYINSIRCQSQFCIKITFLFLWVQYHITWTAQGGDIPRIKVKWILFHSINCCKLKHFICFVFGLVFRVSFF